MVPESKSTREPFFIVMIRFILFLIAAFIPALTSSQVKYDYVWLFGYPPNPGFPHPLLGGSKLDFNQLPPDTSSFLIPISFNGVSVMSDKTGQLLFYTNACQVINKNHKLMSNGDDINPGLYHDSYCSDGYPLFQGILSLPLPGDSARYIIIHYRKEDSGVYKDLMFTIVNMDTPDGLGTVESKNNLLLTDKLAEMLTAVKHGNGRDWWIVAPKTESTEGYLLLLTPDGLKVHNVVNLGSYWDYHGYSCQSVFSPDGTKYVRASPFNDLRLVNFDRCSGTFSNERILPIEDGVGTCGVSISPNSRYLYFSTGLKLYQYDLSVDNIDASKILIGEFDGYTSPFNTTFFQHMLAPDNKIYMNTTSSNNVLHIIHQPDTGGVACNFEQHGLTLPKLHAFMAPNFPFFRLFDLPGSVCDTLGINVATKSPVSSSCIKDLQISPNPANDNLNIEVPECINKRIEIIDARGRLIHSVVISDGSKKIVVSTTEYLPGTYFLCGQTERGQLFAKPFLVLK